MVVADFLRAGDRDESVVFEDVSIWVFEEVEVESVGSDSCDDAVINAWYAWNVFAGDGCLDKVGVDVEDFCDGALVDEPIKHVFDGLHGG